MKIPKRIIIAALFLIILLSSLLYRSSLRTYFFQDDWFTLSISQAKSLEEFINFFTPIKGVIYYRPLGMQFPFFVSNILFGVNPLPLHILVYLIHAVNITLVYLFIKLLTKRDDISLLSSFFYGTSAVHFIPFFWASTISFPLGFMFTILTLILFILCLAKSNTKLIIIVFILESLSLLTNETSLLIPFIILFICLIYKKFDLKINLSLFILPFLYILLRLIYLPKFTDTYSLEIGKKTIYALVTYTLWLLGWPEEVRNQLENILAGNFAYFKSFPTLTIILFIVMIVLISLLIYFTKNVITNPDKNRKKVVLISTLIFSLTITPPLLFPHHTYPYYLFFPHLMLYLIISTSILYLITNLKHPANLFILVLILSLWTISSFMSIEYSLANHWAPLRAKISELVVKDITSRYPIIKSSEKIYLYNDPHIRIILSNKDAFRVIYSKEVDIIYKGPEDLIWKELAADNPSMQKSRLLKNYVQ